MLAGCSLSLWMERALQLEEQITTPAGGRHQPLKRTGTRRPPGSWMMPPTGRDRVLAIRCPRSPASPKPRVNRRFICCTAFPAREKHLLDAIDASLRRLNTDYVDLYQLHMDDLFAPIDETVEAKDTIVRSGRARYIGVSNFLAYRLAKALGRQETLKLTRFVSAQPRYNLLFREVERELFPLAQEEGIAVIPLKKKKKTV